MLIKKNLKFSIEKYIFLKLFIFVVVVAAIVEGDDDDVVDDDDDIANTNK